MLYAEYVYKNLNLVILIFSNEYPIVNAPSTWLFGKAIKAGQTQTELEPRVFLFTTSGRAAGTISV